MELKSSAFTAGEMIPKKYTCDGQDVSPTLSWSDVPAGQFSSTAAFQGDYRWQRQLTENMSLGRNFRFGEGMGLQIRIELTNVFNRTYPADPSATNAKATQTKNLAGDPKWSTEQRALAAILHEFREGKP